jgi:hypothetical protein
VKILIYSFFFLILAFLCPPISNATSLPTQSVSFNSSISQQSISRQQVPGQQFPGQQPMPGQQFPGQQPMPGQQFPVSQQSLISFSSYFTHVETLGEASFKIFAGNTGSTCSGNGENPCNSCNRDISLNDPSLLTSGLVCNDHQIYEDLLFSVTMTSNSGSSYPSGCASLLIGLDGTTLVAPSHVSTYQPNIPNQNITASWKWSDICRALSSDATCKTSFLKTMRVGFNSTCGNNTVLQGFVDFNIAFRFVATSPPMSFGCENMGSFEGFCDYTIFPGDKKLYIVNSSMNVSQNLDTGNMTSSSLTQSTSKDVSGIKYNAIRAYFAEGTFASVKLNSSFIDLPMSLEGGLSNARIMNLENGKTYSVIVANKDQAGNIHFFAHPGHTNSIVMSDDSLNAGSTQAGIPQPVLGLLEDERCFIATAAFGNAHDEQVRTLRQFRDQVLLKFSLGEKFVHWYYQWSPSIAKFISQSPWLRKVTRAILWPFVFFIKQAQAEPELETQTELHTQDFIDDSREEEISEEISEVTPKKKLKESSEEISRKISGGNSEELETQEAQNPIERDPAELESTDLENSSIENSDPYNTDVENTDLDNEDLDHTDGGNSRKDLETDWPSPQEFAQALEELNNVEKRTIDHPLEAKGLLSIHPDGSYKYADSYGKRETTTTVGWYQLPQLFILNTTGSYKDFYGDTLPSIFFGRKEWLINEESWPNLGFRLGLGFGRISGNGLLQLSKEPSVEEYTLYNLPLLGHVIYRLDYFQNQLLSPYVLGGLGYMGFVETRDDSSQPHFAWAPFVEYGGGVQVSLTRIDPKTTSELRESYHVLDLWLYFEGKAINSLKPSMDFSGMTLGGGLILDF